MGGSSKKVTVGYKYYLGMHMILCHGPIDRVKWFKVDDRIAWQGTTTGGSVPVYADGLFGGESREGGVSGYVDIEMGRPDQGRNSYLQSRISSDVPAYRGVVGAVLRQCYLGLNPYLKKWAFRAQRVNVRQDGLPQWYGGKAEIYHPSLIDVVLNETFSNGLSGYSVETGSASDFSLISSSFGACLKIASSAGATIPRLSRMVGPSLWSTLKIKFQITAVDSEDCGVFELFDSSGNLILNFTPVRDASVDSSRRAHLSFLSGSSGLILSDEQLQVGVWYQLSLNIDRTNNSLSGSIVDITTDQVVKSSVGLSLFAYGQVSKVTFRAETSAAAGGVSLWDDIEIYEALHTDMNPAHIIRECLTDPDWGMGYAEEDIDEVSFRDAADKLHAEGMGISLLWDRQVPIESFVQEIVKHINATLYVSRSSGKFVLKLIRADFDEGDLPRFDPSNVERVDNPSRPAFGELTNSVTVNYWNAETGKDASLTVQDTAMIQMQGAVINTTVQYPGFTNFTTASRAALRDLRTLSTPLLSCTLYTNQDARELNIGDVIKFSWPDFEIDQLVMRVTGIAFGDGKSNKIRMTCVQDAFSLPERGLISPPTEGWVDIGGPPSPATNRLILEAPYYELVQVQGQTAVDAALSSTPEIGYLVAAAVRPENALNASVWVNPGSGFEETMPLDFCPSAVLALGVGHTSTSWTFENQSDLDQVTLGTHAQIGSELVRVDSIDLETNTITVGRGVLDTVPRPHAVGSRIYFWDVYNSADGREYADGETIEVKITPASSEGVLDLGSAPLDSLTMDSRAARPYPPGDFRVNSQSYPEGYQLLGNPTLTWSHRDRTQQTSGTLFDHTAGNIGPEAGTTYVVESDAILSDTAVVQNWFSLDVGNVTSYTLDLSVYEPPADSVDLVLRVWTKRGGLLSSQAPEITVNLFGAPTNVHALFIPVDPPYDLEAIEV